MPSTYAHYRFGQMVFDRLTSQQQNLIAPNRSLFDIGLHGPDILFYYHPLKSNAINRSGYAMHDKSGRSFFDQARKIYQQQANQEAHLVYLLGFICHFVLDAKCHPYVEKYVRQQSISHTRIEVEFDRYLLLKDGIKPETYALSQHIHPQSEYGEVIHFYFPGTNQKTIVTALKLMNFYHRLLHIRYDFKRQILYWGMDLIHANSFKDQIMAKKPDLACQKSNEDLYQLWQDAINTACNLIQEFIEKGGNDAPLDLLYDHTFGEE